jgi:hypothetical protein
LLLLLLLPLQICVLRDNQLIDAGWPELCSKPPISPSGAFAGGEINPNPLSERTSRPPLPQEKQKVQSAKAHSALSKGDRVCLAEADYHDALPGNGFSSDQQHDRAAEETKEGDYDQQLASSLKLNAVSSNELIMSAAKESPGVAN